MTLIYLWFLVLIFSIYCIMIWNGTYRITTGKRSIKSITGGAFLPSFNCDMTNSRKAGAFESAWLSSAGATFLERLGWSNPGEIHLKLCCSGCQHWLQYSAGLGWPLSLFLFVCSDADVLLGTLCLNMVLYHFLQLFFHFLELQVFVFVLTCNTNSWTLYTFLSYVKLIDFASLYDLGIICL